MPMLSAGDIVSIRQAVLGAGVFSETVTIQEYMTTTSASGGQIKAWKDKTSHVSIPAFVSSKTGQQQSKTFLVQTVIQTSILLSDYYPLIKETMRAIHSGTTYEITSVGQDSQTLFTKLIVQRVTV